jgi:hypothetical protein
VIVSEGGGETLVRRAVLERGAALAGAALLAACGSTGSRPTAAGPPPWRSTVHTGVFWGVQTSAARDQDYAAYVTALERKLGRRFAAVRQNYWPSGGRSQVSRQIDAAYAAGRRWTYVNGKPKPHAPDAGLMRWASVAGGAYDADFAALFRAIRDDPRWSAANPFHYSFHHEQEVRAQGGGALAGTPAEFRAAFRQVRRLMDTAGAHVSSGGNMRLCWTPDARQLSEDGNRAWPGYPYDATNCDPHSAAGGTPYDLIGCDVYRRSTERAAALWAPLHRWAKMRGVAFFAGEAGVAVGAGAAGDAVAYLRELDGLLHGWGAGGGSGECVAICWTSRVAQAGDYRLDADPAVLREYRRLAHEPLYAASAGASGFGG